MCSFLRLNIDKKLIIEKNTFTSKILVPENSEYSGATFIVDNNSVFDCLTEDTSLDIALAKNSMYRLTLKSDIFSNDHDKKHQIMVRAERLQKIMDKTKWLDFYIAPNDIIDYFKAEDDVYAIIRHPMSSDGQKIRFTINNDFLNDENGLIHVHIPADENLAGTRIFPSERITERIMIRTNEFADAFNQLDLGKNLTIHVSPESIKETANGLHVMIPNGYSFSGAVFEIEKGRAVKYDGSIEINLPPNKAYPLDFGFKVIEINSNDLYNIFEKEISIENDEFIEMDFDFQG